MEVNMELWTSNQYQQFSKKEQSCPIYHQISMAEMSSKLVWYNNKLFSQRYVFCLAFLCNFDYANVEIKIAILEHLTQVMQIFKVNEPWLSYMAKQSLCKWDVQMQIQLHTKYHWLIISRSQT